MASSSSSHQQNQGFNLFSGIEPEGKRRKVSESSRLFDVFINHRGPDVKQTIAAQLYNSLKEVGLRAFLDSEEKELGYSFPSTIETAIKSASVHVAILSKRYAESPWCLAELVLMSQTKAKIIPVFYQVQPWELRFIEKGEYAEAFNKYEKEKRYLEKLPEWKEALQSLSYVAGEEFNGDCREIIAAVQKEVQKKTCLHVATYPVGLDNLVEDFQRRCLNELVQDFENKCGLEETKNKAKVVGIFGMGGSGKTTLAKELFNRKSSNYCKTSFLFDVREASMTGRLPSLQGKLLKDLFQDHSLNPTSIEEGTSYVKDRLQRCPNLSSLIVVDDIDHVEQLNALMVMDIFNNFGDTLVIITTRSVGVLIRAGITVGYNLKAMDRNNGRELFCWHAFGQPHPCSGSEVLVDAFVDVCGGLPLSLQVLGRHVHGKNDSFWRSALIEARKTLPRDVIQRLRISFDALGREEKQVFMDIACFFVGKAKSIAERVWEGSGWNAQHALEILKDKCLVEETEFSSLNVHEGHALRMHDHLRDLGREMAFELSTPLRLWRPKDLEYLESTGFKNILANTHIRCFHSIFDESMGSQVTFFLGQPDICVERSASLLWLEFQGNSSEQPFIPPWISLQYVQCLKIKRGRFKTLWQNNIQAPHQLKELQISGTFLEMIPDFSRISGNLEKVVLDARGWTIQGLSLLESLNMNLCSLNLRSSTLKGVQANTNLGCTSCESLVIWNFKFSGQVAWNNGGKSSSVRAPMAGLERLDISVQELVSKILISGIHYPSLKSIKLDRMENLIEVDLIRIKTLNCLDITNCKHLKSVSGLSYLAKLVLLNINHCPELVELSLGQCLERINIVDCNHLKTVSGSPDLRNHIELNTNVFTELVTSDNFSNVSNISQYPKFEKPSLAHLSCLKEFVIENCRHLNSVSGIWNLDKLVLLNISHCPELEELNLGHLNCLERITLLNCEHLKSVSRVSSFRMLVQLNITECPELEELSLDHLNCLERITLVGYKHLKSVSEVSGLKMLVQLRFSECQEIEELRLAHLSCLENVAIENCNQLKSVSGINNLAKLVELEISDCGNLEFECLCLRGMQCLERIIFDRNVRVKYFELDGCQNIKTIKFGCEKFVELGLFVYPEHEKLLVFGGPICLERIIINGCGEFKDLRLSDCQNLKSISGNLEIRGLYICKCPELEELPSFSNLSCMEIIKIFSCGKLKNIMLPTRLVRLTVQSCRDLQRISVTSDLRELKELYINKCPELEELPRFSSLSFMEEIYIRSCRKLQNIMLPTRLIRLSLRGCRNLNTASGNLYVNQCPDLEELPSFPSSSDVEEIETDSSEEIESIETLQVSRIMMLCYCSNAVIRNCIHKLKSVPLQGVVIGRAVDGAESTLNEHLFSEAGIFADAVTDIVQFNAENSDDELGRLEVLSAVITCCVVVVNDSTLVEDINKSLKCSHFYDWKVRQGEWIIIMLGHCYSSRISEVLRRYGIMKKGFRVGVRKGDKWKTVQLLNIIVDRLLFS